MDFYTAAVWDLDTQPGVETVREMVIGCPSPTPTGSTAVESFEISVRARDDPEQMLEGGVR